jgi:hypothetical protein
MIIRIINWFACLLGHHQWELYGDDHETRMFVKCSDCGKEMDV